MSTLSRELRRILENTVADARKIAEAGAEQALKQLAVDRSAFTPVGSPETKAREQSLRMRLRAHGKQLGDRREPNGTQELRRLRQACAYEHWNRMLFARFLAENNLLIHPDYDQAISLEEIKEQAREQNGDWLSIAASYAQKMLLGVFRTDDPVLELDLPPETRLALDETLRALPMEVFLANDSLGWVYQFWQRDEKDRINKSGVKIGAEQLPAVTQLFTEDYQVLFLLENTLGAWWTAKRRAEGKDPALPGYTWTYLRLNEDGSPAAGSFDTWPRVVKELRVLDPSMGSGHFLIFALPILVRMRIEEEDTTLSEALSAVFKDNLFGLELDERCAQIAAFNLALTAWRMAGGHIALPELNMACCGIGPNTTKDQWIKLGEEIAAKGGMPAHSNLFGSEESLLSEPVKRTMESLHALFSQAPVLGSLIDPSRIRADLFQADYKTIAPLLSAVLKAEHATEETREQVIAAAGMVKAAGLLTGKYTLVATNVPYLGSGKQTDVLREYCEDYSPDGAPDLATVFLDRCARFCESGGAHATVTPQNWLALSSYERFRRRLLRLDAIEHVTKVGSGATSTASWDIPRALAIISHKSPPTGQIITGVQTDAAGEMQRDTDLREKPLDSVSVADVMQVPQARIVFRDSRGSVLLSHYADSYQGLKTGDDNRFRRFTWELPRIGARWRFLQTVTNRTTSLGGLTEVVDWIDGGRSLARCQGVGAWGKKGVLVNSMRTLPATLYFGDVFDSKGAAIVPKEPAMQLAIWEYCASPAFNEEVRRIDHLLAPATASFVQVPFDAAKWAKAAESSFSSQSPGLLSPDPRQWIFDGALSRSEHALQVATARLVGYLWPRQTGSKFGDWPALCEDGLERFADSDGIVPLSSIAGESSAADRLRALLAAAYGDGWSAAKLAELLGDNESLESWLRDHFFEEHCNLFKAKETRPFVWHVWDGRKDGFHVLVNYHKLAASKGEGRKTLEKLIYTTLGDWITRQGADSKAGADGADGRLAAALHLKAELEKILAGEKPYDIFVRWKPLEQQPIGWEPDINDGVRMNIRPWLAATLSPRTGPKRDACILRVTPKIKYGRDRGEEPQRKKEDFPWFWTWDEKSDDFAGSAEFDGARWNDLHYKLETKQKARERRQASERTKQGNLV